MKNRLIKRALSFAAAVVLSGAPALALPPATQPAEKLTKEQTDFFESKVRPILVAHCYKCHSVEEKKSKGGLVLDTRAQAASCCDTSLPLTTREYALLEFMARRADRVVTREDVAEHVWDSSYDPLSNVIDVYVRRLRAKLAPAGCGDAIRTRRGAGYLLTAERSEQEP